MPFTRSRSHMGDVKNHSHRSLWLACGRLRLARGYIPRLHGDEVARIAVRRQVQRLNQCTTAGVGRGM